MYYPHSVEFAILILLFTFKLLAFPTFGLNWTLTHTIDYYVICCHFVGLQLNEIRLRLSMSACLGLLNHHLALQKNPYSLVFVFHYALFLIYMFYLPSTFIC